jgi:hypothetical protein
MLAHMTFGMESLGNYRSSGREADRVEAIRFFEEAAANKIVFYILHKWARALSIRTDLLSVNEAG